MKKHLEHTWKTGSVCQNGKVGGALYGEHFTYSFDEFRTMNSVLRCKKCEKSSMFSFLMKKSVV